jgi:hypothetical protein
VAALERGAGASAGGGVAALGPRGAVGESEGGTASEGTAAATSASPAAVCDARLGAAGTAGLRAAGSGAAGGGAGAEVAEDRGAGGDAETDDAERCSPGCVARLDASAAELRASRAPLSCDDDVAAPTEDWLGRSARPDAPPDSGDMGGMPSAAERLGVSNEVLSRFTGLSGGREAEPRGDAGGVSRPPGDAGGGARPLGGVERPDCELERDQRIDSCSAPSSKLAPRLPVDSRCEPPPTCHGGSAASPCDTRSAASSCVHMRIHTSACSDVHLYKHCGGGHRNGRQLV